MADKVIVNSNNLVSIGVIDKFIFGLGKDKTNWEELVKNKPLGYVVVDEGLAEVVEQSHRWQRLLAMIHSKRVLVIEQSGKWTVPLISYDSDNVCCYTNQIMGAGRIKIDLSNNRLQWEY